MKDLRVVSGEFRGFKLVSPNSAETHPMGAREKLALFNMVNVSGKTVLDAFAGSGALGIEALSRGANMVIFVENSPRAGRVIQENLVNLSMRDDGVLGRTEILLQKVGNFSQDKESHGKFDVIFADPPYGQIDITGIQSLVNLIAENGMLVVSSPAGEPALNLAGVEMASSRTYAGARLSVYTLS